MEVWKFGKSSFVSAWKFGTLGVWNFGSLGVWEFGTLEVWEFGTLGVCFLEVWKFGDRYLRTTNCPKLGVRPFLRSAVSPNLHTLVRYLMRGTLIGSCGGLEFDSYNPFHEAIDTSGAPTALN